MNASTRFVLPFTMLRPVILIFALFFTATSALALKQVAVTIDDLPFAGDARIRSTPKALAQFSKALLEPLRRRHVPFIGFVNEKRIKDLTPAQLRDMLDIWLDYGGDLGNHTATHRDLNHTPLAQYEEDIINGEAVTSAALKGRGRNLRYFRHPYLHTGTDLETKHSLEEWLSGRGYTVAPVTLDTSDWMFASVYGQALLHGNLKDADEVRSVYLLHTEAIVQFFENRSMEVMGRQFPQILLIHANLLNRDAMPALLDLFRKHSYEFVSLSAALNDPAYREPDGYAGPNGVSWINRWAFTRHMQPKASPGEPNFIRIAYQRAQEARK